MTVISVITGALGKGLEKGLEELKNGGRSKTKLTTAVLRSAKILRRVL